MTKEKLRKKFEEDTGMNSNIDSWEIEPNYVYWLEDLVLQQAKFMRDMDMYFCNVCGGLTPNPEGVCGKCLEEQG